MPLTTLRPLPRAAVRSFARTQARNSSSFTTSSNNIPLSPFSPRHLLSIADLTPHELSTLVLSASSHKTAIKSTSTIPSSLHGSLSGQTVAMLFNKRSTRTRVSTESAVATMGGHAMFLGKDDIQLGVNESVRDTSIIISSMTSAMVARVGEHSEVEDLAKYSSVPVINALSVTSHPLQTIADFLTIHEIRNGTKQDGKDGLGLEGLKIAWVGDSNNVCIDLCLGAVKLGCQISVASPEGYSIPSPFVSLINSSSTSSNLLFQTTSPEEAIKGADIIFTDTWISMGQEEESKKRIKDFEGYQITEELAKRGGARDGWRFMHCLPRHKEEVDDEVFYGPRSLVFPEGENRLWAAIAALEGFVVNKGKIV